MKVMFKPMRFTGVEQQEKYYQWLNAMPQEAKERIKKIDDSRSQEGNGRPSLYHIAVAKWHGRLDKDVHALNTEILSLVKQRRQEREKGLPHKPATEKLQDLRVALDRLLKSVRENQKQLATKPVLGLRGVFARLWALLPFSGKK